MSDHADTPKVPVPDASTLDARAVSAAPLTTSASAWLLMFRGDSSRRIMLPESGELTIGRAESNDICLDEFRVSRHHARLTMAQGEGRLADLDSQNGTLLNDEPLVGQRLLNSGDSITIGDTTLIYHSSARTRRPSTFLDANTYRSRADIELERATRFVRPLALIDFHFRPAPDRPRVQLALEPVLRRLDLACWTSTEHLTVVAPELDLAAGRELANRCLEALEPLAPGARAGLALFSEDGGDAETLQAAARAAALSVTPGELGLAQNAFQLLTIGSHQVLVADGAMLRLYELVRRLANSELAILVHGETGSGKELIAHAVHAQSRRASKRMVAVNCAALQESLLESELFGHERGAFTGATSAKEGLLEVSSGGTVFLDEVGEMSPALQAKLLRALETRRITRVGDTREREVDLRVVAATHKDLEAEVKAGRFRQDLYFRLVGATVYLPPLRSRRREIPLLSRRFLEEASAKLGRIAPMLSPTAVQALAQHAWPGNVRELKNVMEYAAATVHEDVVEQWHLADRLFGQSTPPAPTVEAPPKPALTFRPIGDEVRDLEQRRMLEALDRHGWNQTRAAGAIEMPLRTFVTKFKQYDLSRHRKV